MTRRFLPTWRPGQAGGDGGQSSAAAGAHTHSSQGSPALAGPLSLRRLAPQSPAVAHRDWAPSLLGAGGASDGVAGKRPPCWKKPRSPSSPLQGRPLGVAKTFAPLGRTAAGPARPFLLLPLPSTPPRPHLHSLSFLFSSSPCSSRPAAGSRGSDSRRLLLCVHV